jgi:hypothetical protein
VAEPKVKVPPPLAKLKVPPYISMVPAPFSPTVKVSLTVQVVNMPLVKLQPKPVIIPPAVTPKPPV